jgi:hypothetical protein
VGRGREREWGGKKRGRGSEKKARAKRQWPSNKKEGEGVSLQKKKGSEETIIAFCSLPLALKKKQPGKKVF